MAHRRWLRQLLIVGRRHATGARVPQLLVLLQVALQPQLEFAHATVNAELVQIALRRRRLGRRGRRGGRIGAAVVAVLQPAIGTEQLAAIVAAVRGSVQCGIPCAGRAALGGIVRAGRVGNQL